MNILLGSVLTWFADIDPAEIPANATSQIGWTNMPSSWRVFIFVALMGAMVLLAVVLYRREMATCPRRVKLFLTALRVAVVLLLACVFLGPAITYTRTTKIDPVLVLMRDASYSMNEPDRYKNERAAAAVVQASGYSADALRAGEVVRADVLNKTLRRDGGAWLRELDRRGKVRVLDFATGTKRVEFELPLEAPDGPATEAAEPLLPPVLAAGQGTDLVNAITQGLTAPNVAAVVLMTDGQHTVKNSGGNELLLAARQAKDRDVPLLFVGIGDPTIAANVKVADVYAPSEVWKNHPFEIQAQLRLQNVSIPSLHIELLEQRLDDDGAPVEQLQVIQQRDVDVKPNASQLRYSFEHVVEQKGRYAYSVRVTPFDSETNTEDNQPKTVVPVQVLSDMRVLLVAGQADWEYQLVRVLLQRDASINLSCWLQNLDRRRVQDGNTPIRQLPRTASELAEYDVVMLFDPNPQALPPGWLEQIKQFVGDESRGLFYLAGRNFSAALLSGRETSTARDMLPVDFGDIERSELESLGETYQRTWEMEVAARSVDLPIMRFFSDPQISLRKWRSMPGFSWSFPALEAKPAARVLIERKEEDRGAPPRPLLVTGMYGSGRVVYMGFNGTWRWRRAPNDVTFYRRFWLQTIRYLVEGQSAASRGRGTVEADRQRYALGDRIRISARRVKDEAYELLKDDTVTVRIQAEDGPAESVELKAVPGEAGVYTGAITAAAIGRHKVTLEQAGATPPTTTFMVTVPQLEANETWLNEPLLVNLADASGGDYFYLDELDDVLKKIPDDKAKHLRVKGQPIPLWDNNRILLLLVGMLCCEWSVRKKFRLI